MTPTTSVPSTAPRPSHQPNQIVVATPYAELVTRRLRSWQTGAKVIDHDDRLGLSLVSLTEKHGLRYLREEQPERVEAAERAIDHDGARRTDLDVLLRVLRGRLRDQHGGWVPTIGKNRNVERLRGSYVIDGGGAQTTLTLLPQYVIDGGGLAGPTALAPGQRRVPRRASAPGAGARIGIVDTLLYPHPWLAGSYVATSADLLDDENPGDHPARSHATFVAGMVARQAPGANLTVMGALDDDASADTWTVARRIADLAEAGVDVVNLSFGCVTEDHQPPLVLAAAIRSLPREVTVVAAAGNHGAPGADVAPVWPAALDQVVAVGALDGDVRADFSPDAPWVDALAPGTSVVSTCRPDGAVGWFGSWSGTSFAAGAVAGAIAAGMRPGVSSRGSWDALRAATPGDGPVRVDLREDTGWPTT